MGQQDFQCLDHFLRGCCIRESAFEVVTRADASGGRHRLCCCMTRRDSCNCFEGTGMRGTIDFRKKRINYHFILSVDYNRNQSAVYFNEEVAL